MALRLALKERLRETWKWSIDDFYHCILKVEDGKPAEEQQGMLNINVLLFSLKFFELLQQWLVTSCHQSHFLYFDKVMSCRPLAIIVSFKAKKKKPTRLKNSNKKQSKDVKILLGAKKYFRMCNKYRTIYCSWIFNFLCFLIPPK